MEYYNKLWENTIPFTNQDGDMVDTGEIGGFMTSDQKEFIIAKNKNLKVNNEIELTCDLEIMLNEVVVKHFTSDEMIANADDDLDEILDIMRQNEFDHYGNENDDENVKRGFIPADIIFTNTIPVPNLRLIRETSIDTGKGKRDGIIIYTVFMYDEISKFINTETTEEKTIVIGFMKREIILNNGERVEVSGYPIITDINTDNMSLRIDRFHFMLPQQSVEYFEQAQVSEKEKITNNIVDVYVEMSTILAHYYAIQQLLLNPLIKKYSKTFRVDDQLKKGGGKNGGKKKPVKYIKRIKIDTDDTIDLIYKKNEKGERVRKTLIWYVCGHWVKKKNGTRFFRHGYWKGPLRDSNPELFVDGVRQREIV
jgi:hypothetical protein